MSHLRRYPYARCTSSHGLQQCLKRIQGQQTIQQRLYEHGQSLPIAPTTRITTGAFTTTRPRPLATDQQPACRAAGRSHIDPDQDCAKSSNTLEPRRRKCIMQPRKAQNLQPRRSRPETAYGVRTVRLKMCRALRVVKDNSNAQHGHIGHGVACIHAWLQV